MDISVFEFYVLVGNIGEISMNIKYQSCSKLMKMLKKLLKIDKIETHSHIKVILYM